jgi:hypothetical protein
VCIALIKIPGAPELRNPGPRLVFLKFFLLGVNDMLSALIFFKKKKSGDYL